MTRRSICRCEEAKRAANRWQDELPRRVRVPIFRPIMTMRVLHIDTGSDWRGGQRQLFLLAQGLRESGYEPLVVAPPATLLAERLRSRGLAVSAVPMRAAWDLTAARRLRRLLRTWNPDVVHAHDDRGHALALAALVGTPDTPLVVTRRTTARPTPLGLQYGRRVSRYVAVSRAVRAALIDGGIDPVSVDIVPPGIAVPEPVDPRDWRRERGWPSNTVVCGVVGAVTGDEAAGLLEGIAAALPDAARERARLVLLGGRATGRRVVGGLDAFGAGHVDGGWAAIAGLDVVWHIARSQGLGTAALDAMAAGVPPIAFASGALPELIEHDRSGILVSDGDTKAFAAAAGRLIRDDRRRRILAAGGPASAARFDAGAMVQGYHRVYRSLFRELVPA